MMTLNVLKVFGLSMASLVLGILITPILTHYLYKYKMWKKSSRSYADTSADFQKIHNHNGEMHTPRIGGVLIWGSVVIVSLVMWLVTKIYPTPLTLKLNFLSQNQTWLPLFAFLTASLVGLLDDLLQIYQGAKNKLLERGLPRCARIGVVITIGLIGAYWFYFKLGMHSIHIPFYGNLELGWLLFPFFVITMLAVFSGGVIDGIDGLSGGVMASIFASYGVIAYLQNQVDIATLCMVIVGGVLAFLWFNIPPARFYMGETGMLGLTVVLTIIAFLTDAVAVLPIIAFPLAITSFSASAQMFSKKYFGRKIFKVAPIHHHFEAIGWPSYKVVMRFWVAGIFFAVVGLVLQFL